MRKNFLIVDDSPKWVLYHKDAVRQIFNDNAEIDTAYCAKEAVEKIMYSIDSPYDFILTDMQMEPDFLPLYAGEWFIKQVQSFKEYKNSKIIIISASENIKQIAKNYNVDYIPKYRCNKLDEYCNKLLNNE